MLQQPVSSPAQRVGGTTRRGDLDLLAADECPVGMHRLFAAVLGVEAGDEGVQVVTVLGVAESLKHLSHQRPRLLKVGSLAMCPTMDRRSWA